MKRATPVDALHAAQPPARALAGAAQQNAAAAGGHVVHLRPGRRGGHGQAHRRRARGDRDLQQSERPLPARDDGRERPIRVHQIAGGALSTGVAGAPLRAHAVRPATAWARGLAESCPHDRTRRPRRRSRPRTSRCRVSARSKAWSWTNSATPFRTPRFRCRRFSTPAAAGDLLPASPSSDAGPARPTDDLGRFRVGGLPPGDYYVEALSGAFADPNGSRRIRHHVLSGNDASLGGTSGDGGGRTRREQCVVRADAGADGPRLRNGGGWDGWTRRSRHADAHAERDVPGTALFVIVRSATDERGRFTFRNVPPGVYTIQAFGAQVGTGGNLGCRGFRLSDVHGRRPGPRRAGRHRAGASHDPRPHYVRRRHVDVAQGYKRGRHFCPADQFRVRADRWRTAADDDP